MEATAELTRLNLTGTRQTATNTPAPTNTTNTPTPTLHAHPHSHRHSHSRAHQYRHPDTPDQYTGDHSRRPGPTRSAGRTRHTGRAVGSRVRRAPQGCGASEVKREYRVNAGPGATLESTDGMATQDGKAFKALRANRVTMPVPHCCTSLSPWRSYPYWLPWPAWRWAGCAQPDSRLGKCTVTAGRWIPL